jgi:hypothetical protein
LGTERIHWDPRVDNDWLDPDIVVKFDELLRKRTDLAIYSNHTDFGQSALFTCMSGPEFAGFQKLSRVKLGATRDKA